MRITLIDAGKRFNRDWVFRHLHYQFHTGKSYAITGSNGSGKSTLLQAIAGAIEISEGRARFEQPVGELAGSAPVAAGAGSELPLAHRDGSYREIPADQVYKYLSLSAPYLELIEEMTLTEFLQFHGNFKPLLPGHSIPDIISRVGLETAAHKQIRYYSSGMKQRVKLAQSIFSDTPVVLLDEPCTNLDADGVALYRQLIREYCEGRLLIVSSNDRQEYDFCGEIINIMDYKGSSGD
jgi:ABC-type multidrug transport system ATPase subunit